jgi:hypothetical protein
MCQNLRHPETQPESLLPLANHCMMVILLLLMRSNKTVFSGERADIYVGERLRLAAAVEGIGNNLSGARSFSGRCGDRRRVAATRPATNLLSQALFRQNREFGSHYRAPFSIGLSAIT